MTQLCTLTGTIIAPDGSALGGASAVFVPRPRDVVPAGDDTVAPKPVTVTADGSGDIAAAILDGQYTVRVTGADGAMYPTFTVTVPDAPVAVLGQIIDMPPPPTLDAAQQAVVAAQSARDQANVHKIAAEAARVGAETAETGAQAAEGAALASEQAAAGSEAAALASEQAAAGSASAALASEQAALASEQAAAASEGAALASEQAAAASEQAALASEQAALASEQAAAASESAAGASETAAETARDKAAEWADEAEDTPVETGPDRFSAFHWSEKAAASAALGTTAIAGLRVVIDALMTGDITPALLFAAGDEGAIIDISEPGV
jgi:hypothetical protein